MMPACREEKARPPSQDSHIPVPTQTDIRVCPDVRAPLPDGVHPTIPHAPYGRVAHSHSS